MEGQRTVGQARIGYSEGQDGQEPSEGHRTVRGQLWNTGTEDSCGMEGSWEKSCDRGTEANCLPGLSPLFPPVPLLHDPHMPSNLPVQTCRHVDLGSVALATMTLEVIKS